MGLAFKADIDDLRESPAVEITHKIIEEQLGEVLIVEPHIKELPEILKAGHVLLVSFTESLETANIFVTLTDHTAFSQIKHNVFLKEKIVIDARGVWEKDQ